jgi:hypothetical protein
MGGSKKAGDGLERKTYVITAAQAAYEEKFNSRTEETEYFHRGNGGKLHKQFMNGLERFCKDRDAELIIRGMNGVSAAETIMHESMDPHLDDISYNVIKLNDQVQVSDMVVPPQNVDPTTGRLRFAQQNKTLIYAHSKQRFRAVPASNFKLPKLLITTGAVTTPNYNASNHRGDVALRDHVFGAVVLETIGDKYFNVRHVRAQKDGKFIDLGVKYNGRRAPTHAKVDSLVLGDLHVGDEDDDAVAANFEMIDYFKPQRVFIHDLFNGHSVNPHERDKTMRRVYDWENGRLSLEEELINCNTELNRLAKAVGKKGEVFVVASNHNDFLNRYLDRGDFLREPWNASVALKLAGKLCEDKDPVEAGVRMVGNVPSNVTFLDLDSDLKRWGYQFASHGHKGNSGARGGTAKSREIAHGKSITAHSHTPETFRDTHVVGTSTKLNLPYTEGSASSWMAANAVLYDGGLVQLIPVIRGKWKMKQ